MCTQTHTRTHKALRSCGKQWALAADKQELSAPVAVSTLGFVLADHTPDHKHAVSVRMCLYARESVCVCVCGRL